MLPCAVQDGRTVCLGQTVETANPPGNAAPGTQLQIGVRPEFVKFAAAGVPARVTRVSDAGRYRIVDADCQGTLVKLLVVRSSHMQPPLQYRPSARQTLLAPVLFLKIAAYRP